MKNQHQRGFVIFYTTILVLSLSLAMAGSIYVLTLSNQKIARNLILSSQAYYAAESGIEDATYRIKNLLPYSASYTLAVGSSQTNVTVTSAGTLRTVESDGNNQNSTRKLQAILNVSTTSVSFFYGIQTGNDGISMGDGSSIIGNVFSNGDINGVGVSKSTITGTAQAAGSSGIRDIKVNGNAYADHLSNCSVGGNASYVLSISNCSAGSTSHVSQQLAAQNFPITQSQITGWQNDALAGDTLSNYSLGNNASSTLGPKKINGNITLGNGATLTLTGTVWATGTINFGNNVTIKLDPSYGVASGILLLNGSASIGNGAILKGSGQSGSNLILLSTFGSGQALSLGNGATGDIFYAPNGTINVGNGLNVKEVTGNGLDVGNNTTVTYQSGLASINFTSGPGASFQVIGWKEIQ